MTTRTHWYCNTCFAELTVEEHQYYDDRCTKCEREWFDRIEAWRRGAPDPTLDELYSEHDLPSRH